MTGPLHRRDFIRSVSLAGASVAIAGPLSPNEFLPPTNENEIENDFFKVFFDKSNGRYSIFKKNGNVLLAGATACINTSTVKRSISSNHYNYRTDSKSFEDQLGPCKKLIIRANDPERKLDLEIHLTLYDGVEGVVIEAFCKNVSKKDIEIKSLEPARAIAGENGMINMPGVSKCITNGEMYFDVGTIYEFQDNKGPVFNGDLKGIKLSNKSVSTNNETIHSWWNAGFFSGYDNEGLVIGYLENNNALGNLLIARTGPGQISFLAESVYAPDLMLRPGNTISSNRLLLNSASNPYKALENYATTAGKINNARTVSVINGWCSWFYTLGQVSEEEVIANTEFAAKHLKQFGLEYIQIDEGYQRWHGDWEGNKRFPHGMKWLADQIKRLGLKPGIWISPYVISETTELFQQHPDWLVKGLDGRPQRIGNWSENETPPADENPKRYCLDITHPSSSKWLHDLIDTIANDWGYQMIKIDFMAWSVLAAERFHDPTVSTALIYRRGLEIMRDAAGKNCHILDCGPGAVTVGLIDSMRIEADVNYGFTEAAWSTYFTHPACSASAAGKRYYFHKRTWINDVDHICMSMLNNQQSEAAATIIAMSGGNMISGDRLTQLDPYKLEILTKITPSFGEAAVPVDLFDTDMPSVFALRVKKRFGEWTVIALFNSSLTESIEKKFPLKRVWLDPGKTYLAFDFWNQQFRGEIKEELSITIPPGSVRLLTLHEKSGRPQFISTDRHILQGAIEMEDVNWNEPSKTISGISKGSLNNSYKVSVYFPGEHPWTWGGSALYRDFESYTIKLMDNHIVEVQVRFEKSEQVHWEIKEDYFNK